MFSIFSPKRMFSPARRAMSSNLPSSASFEISGPIFTRPTTGSFTGAVIVILLRG